MAIARVKRECLFFSFSLLQLFLVPTCLLSVSHSTLRGEWPSGPASSISFAEVKHGCVRSETGWVTFRMNDQTAHSGTLN